MTKMNRRHFLKTSFAGTLALAHPFARARGANSDIRVAVIGFRSKGKQHIEVFRKLPGVRVTALCDIDPQILNQTVGEFRRRNEPVFATVDAREILDRTDVDAVVIASANHWHALQTIWACQAGKDVYVEKPVSHNNWEGQQMIKAARKYGRVVQAGTQTRSDVGFREVSAYINSGQVGKIQHMHCILYRRRQGIGKRRPYFPAWFDYDHWCGPAQVKPLERENFHYDWHWKWHTGNGDLGNIGIHQVDVCRALGGYDTLPSRVIGIGQRYGFDDAGDTPNTQLTILDYGPAPILVENRNLPRAKGNRAMNNYRGTREGHVIQCEGGYYVGSYNGGWLYDNRGKKIKQFVGDGGGTHQQNFIDAVRQRDASLLRADVSEGVLSTACCLMGNVSLRVGDKAGLQTITKSIQTHTQGLDALNRMEAHLRANEIDPDTSQLNLGSWLDFDTQSGRIERVKNGRLQQARDLMRRNYRKPFVVPNEV